MEKYRLISWCHSATCMIRFKPDRKAVYNELMGHLEERRDAYIEQGLDEKEATTKTLDAMGSPYKIASQLGAIHRPFWGYYLRVAKILLFILLVLSLIPIRNYIKSLPLYNKLGYWDFNVYSTASYGGDTGRTLLHMSKPNLSFSSDGSKFTLTNAVVFTEYSERNQRYVTRLYVLIQQESLLPQTEHSEYLTSFGITAWFIARDDLGNVYPGMMEKHDPDKGTVQTDSIQTGIFTSLHECWITNFPPEAKWVEIGYERDGRSYALRIDLTGGAAE